MHHQCIVQPFQFFFNISTLQIYKLFFKKANIFLKNFQIFKSPTVNVSNIFYLATSFALNRDYIANSCRYDANFLQSVAFSMFLTELIITLCFYFWQNKLRFFHSSKFCDRYRTRTCLYGFRDHRTTSVPIYHLKRQRIIIILFQIC